MDPEGRRARAAKVAAAIEAYMGEMGYDGVLGDWVVIGSAVRVDPDGDPNCEYFMAMSGGSMLQHHLLGLLAKADEIVAGNDLEAPDE
jgi:hypothetical protein